MHLKQLAMNYLYYSDPYVGEIISTIFTALKSFESIQQNISLPSNNFETEIGYIFYSLRKKKVNIEKFIHSLFCFSILNNRKEACVWVSFKKMCK